MEEDKPKSNVSDTPLKTSQTPDTTQQIEGKAATEQTDEVVSKVKPRKKRTKPSSSYQKSVLKRQNRKKYQQELAKKRKDSYKFIEALTEMQKLASYSNMANQTLSVHINTAINASKSDQNINSFCDLDFPLEIKRSILIVTSDKNIKSSADIKVITPLELTEMLTKKAVLKYTKIITSQDCMGVFLKHARILGPRGQLPNLKNGTISSDLKSLAKTILTRRVFIKNDKGGVFHIPIGKMASKPEHLLANTQVITKKIIAGKPSKITAAGFITSVYLTSTLSPSFPLNRGEIC